MSLPLIFFHVSVFLYIIAIFISTDFNKYWFSCAVYVLGLKLEGKHCHCCYSYSKNVKNFQNQSHNVYNVDSSFCSIFVMNGATSNYSHLLSTSTSPSLWLYTTCACGCCPQAAASSFLAFFSGAASGVVGMVDLVVMVLNVNFYCYLLIYFYVNRPSWEVLLPFAVRF